MYQNRCVNDVQCPLQLCAQRYLLAPPMYAAQSQPSRILLKQRVKSILLGNMNRTHRIRTSGYWSRQAHQK